MIDRAFEWLSNEPLIGCALFVLLAFGLPWLLVSIANRRRPMDMPPLRRRQLRDRDEHEDGIPW